ncbi:MAG TPA: bifunctional shikimate kinase/3-dehydroquinate synthase [Solirubrobacteraceae bacterium]|nr:bifunctional shikimate kinase/3-dehydroquinate synthase [Solirubrobacteraceae bacterium]
MALVLIGFMGAGKSTLAGRLAALRGRAPIDGDALLVERFGHSVAREFELHGEQAFRAAEEEVVCGLLEGVDARDVIALGGGSVLSARVRAALTGHTTALIEVAPEVAWERVHRDDGSERPLARDRDAFEALYAERRGLYEQVADARLLWAESASGAYPVFVGSGLLTEAGGHAPAALADLGMGAERVSPQSVPVSTEAGRHSPTARIPVSASERLAAVWPFDRTASRPFYVTDETVGGLYAGRLGELKSISVPRGESAKPITMPPGESAKTLATAERVWRELAHAGMTRADHLVALGGGVVGDLAGFCAATYQRGVPVVQIPTTLVAQVDSAYGGKTGVDLPEAKNYVGAYHQPAAVLVDPDTLRTLPPEELSAGWVEVLKTALIAGGELWERVAAEAPGSPPDERTILACARLKLAVVAEDERDGGRRQVLNLGHTVGHAIETATAYGRYRHGEAVGLGLLAALRLSSQEQLRAHVHALLGARGLPVALEGASVDEVVAAVAHDKKRVGAASTPFVLVGAPGDVRVGCEVAEDELHAAVAELAS